METIFDEPGTEDTVKLIEKAFLKLSTDPKVTDQFPGIKKAADLFLASSQISYNDATEIAFLDLYCELHRAGSEYSSKERQTLDDKKGYFNHPGGISPLLKAKSHIRHDSITADLGAGNGLQGLLFQYLYPHQKTLQIELSAKMIQVGKTYQEILEIPEERIVWINDDIINTPLDEVDFLYLYRPSKPIGDGIKLYETLKEKLERRTNPLVIFSIADCLKDFLDSGFEVFYDDGHLTCFNGNNNSPILS